MTSKVFTHLNLDEIKLSGKNLADCTFEDCDLSGLDFSSCELNGAKFNRCFTQADTFVNFSNAKCQNTHWKGCRLPHANFNDADLSGSEFRNTNLSYANCRNTHWDESKLENVNFSMVDFDLASFRNVKILRVQHLPAKVTGTRHFLRLLIQRKTTKHTIFTSGTELSPFIEYCSREYRLSQLLLELEELPFIAKLPRILFAAIIGLCSDFGHSLNRWLVSALVIISSYSLYFNFIKKSMFNNLSDAWHHSLLHFINLGEFTPATYGWGLTSLNVLGYFMLGMLISIITNRFVSRW